MLRIQPALLGVEMRKGQKFTQKKMLRWLENGRGTGAGADYTAWHRVSRDDPGSRGSSYWLPTIGHTRHADLLSDLERVASMFARMLPGLLEEREQFPLQTGLHLGLDEHGYERIFDPFSGTEVIAKKLGYRHPRHRDLGSAKALWVMSTDLLLVQVSDTDKVGKKKYLAVSVKQFNDIHKKRVRELLLIEKMYWNWQGIPWLLITEETYDDQVRQSLMKFSAHAFGLDPLPETLLTKIAKIVLAKCQGLLASRLDSIQATLNCNLQTAQAGFWQAVWKGLIPVNLAKVGWPTNPVEIISARDFWLQNPIVSRRSSWSE